MVSASGLTLIFSVLFIGCSAENKALQTNDISDYYVHTSINFIFDLFLRRYTEKLVETGKTEVQIPGFQKSFSTRILTMNVEGAIVVNDGWCSNISTVHRTGDAEMERADKDVTLTAHLGLRELKIDYNNYDISFLGAHQKGNIKVDIGENSVWLKLSAQLVPKCDITLTDMKIEQVENIKVVISNLGIFESMTDDITSWVVNEVTRWYRSYIEDTLFPEVAKIVKDADLCHYLPIKDVQIG